MPIKWSATKVSEAMDEVEAQVSLADQFIAEAKAKVEAAKKIPKLPQYMEHRFQWLVDLYGPCRYPSFLYYPGNFAQRAALARTL